MLALRQRPDDSLVTHQTLPPPDPRRQFRTLYRDFLVRLVDLEVLSATGDPQKLIGQFGALLASFGLVLAIYILPGYASSNLSRDQMLLAAWGNQEFLI